MNFGRIKLFGSGNDSSELEGEKKTKIPITQDEPLNLVPEPSGTETGNPTDAPPNDEQRLPIEDDSFTPSTQLEESPSLLNIDGKVDTVLVTLAELQQEIGKQADIDKFKDEAILRFSKQLEVHELGLMRKIKESLLKEIILFYDTVERFQRKFSYLEDDRLNYDLQLLKEEVEEILYRHDVVLIEPLIKVSYDRDSQKVISKEPTEVASEHDQIARIFRQGFRLDDRILRKQEVIMKEYSPTSV